MSGLVLWAALAGCTTLYEGQYDLQKGWRPATVLSVGDAASIGYPVVPDCGELAQGSPASADRYAAVRYRWLGRTLHRKVALVPGTTVKADDAVYVNVLSCPTPLVARSAGSK